MLERAWGKKRYRRLLSITIIGASFVVAIGILAMLYRLSTPRFDTVRYSIDGGPQQEGRLPLFLPSQGERTFAVDITLSLPPLAQKTFIIRPDDCLEKLIVNGQTITDGSIPFCDYVNGRSIDLRSVLRSGENIIRLTIRDNGGMGGIDISPARSSPLPIALMAGFFLVLTGYGIAFTWWVLRRRPNLRPFGYIFLGGILLRLIYLLTTPYTVRGHDADGHLEYIRYIATHWSLPDPHGGWEFYQPPLYYILGAVWIHAGRLIGLTESMEPFALQIFALILSIASLLLLLWIARILFPPPQRRCHALLLFVCCTTFPSIVFLAARINNDVLAFPLALVILVFLLRFWQHRHMRDLYVAALSLGIALLTKSTAFLLLLPLTATLLCTTKLTFLRKCEILSAVAVIMLLVAGWFHIPRYLAEQRTDAFFVGNIGNLNSGLRTSHSLKEFFTFNPLEILRHPFNNPWTDTERRAHVWEYFFRSAFFGEFSFNRLPRPLAIAMLSTTLPLLLLIPIGILRDLRRRRFGSLPTWTSLLATLLGTTGIYILVPYASGYDFRYALLAVPTTLFYIIHSIGIVPKLVRIVGYVLLLSLAVVNAGFLLALAIIP